MFPLYTLLYFHCLLLIGEASAEITPAEKCIPYLIRAKSFCFPEKNCLLIKKEMKDITLKIDCGISKKGLTPVCKVFNYVFAR